VRISRIRLSRKPESRTRHQRRTGLSARLKQERSPVKKSGSSVVGLSPKRNSRPLTGTCFRSAPSLHGRYPLPRYYGLSDSREKKQSSRVSQVPRPIYPHAPSPTTPESPMAAFSRCFRHRWQASSKSDGLATFTGVTRLNRVRLRYGSCVRLARLRPRGLLHASARSATSMNGLFRR
jgi:hypothetical protein